jgi:heptosyltransferase-2
MGYKTLQYFLGGRRIQKILVLQLGGIGDMVISSVALKALRAAYKDAYIGLAVIGRAKELMVGNPAINEIFVFELRDTKIRGLLVAKAWMSVYRIIQLLRRHKFDLLINLEQVATWKGAFKMALFAALIRAKYTLGRNTDGKGFFWDFRIAEDGAVPLHEVDCSVRLCEVAGAYAETMSLELPVFGEDRAFISSFLQKASIQETDLLVGFNPGAFVPFKKWPKKNWIDLAKRLIKEYNCKIIVTGHSSEQKECEEITKAVGMSGVIPVYKFNLKQISALIEKTRLFITNDSGPMHIACAVHTPVIALFGPGDHRRFYPYPANGQNIVIRKEIDCVRPCYRFGCRQKRCMDYITVEDVFKVAQRILSVC